MIEFDQGKDRVNIAKHGVSLALAAEFDFEGAVTFVDRRFDYGEERLNAYGLIGAELFVVTYTARSPNIRVISMRRAGGKELQRWRRR